ncbi:hypothetical protein, partial [Burkholderia thailandensis]|uniref:hypothetical protein n=1 Tax=Burkholderia thailandensis TaxID=57975 RepID=UPI00217E7471
SLSSNLVPEVPCDRAIPPPDIHKIRRQVTQSFSKAPRFSAMNQKNACQDLTYAQLAKSSQISTRSSHHLKPSTQCIDFIDFFQVQRLRAI